MKEKSTDINTQEQKGTKENPGRKRKPDPAENILFSSENIDKGVPESVAINDAISCSFPITRLVQLMLTVMRVKSLITPTDNYQPRLPARLTPSLRRLKCSKEN